MMKKFLLLVVACLTLLPLAIHAVPALPIKKTITLQDGSKVEVTFTGDEHISFWRAKDGRAFRKLGEEKFERISDAELAAMVSSANQVRQDLNSNRAARIRRRVGEMNGGLKGTKKGLVILVNFKDNAFKANHDNAFYQRYFNEVGFNDNGSNGSVSDYFRAQSYGEFSIDFDIAGPYTLPQNMAYYGAPSGSSHDVRPADMAWDAITLADPDVNYKDYDWDGDGTVDQVFIVYAGYGEAQGAPANTIWPHEWSVRAATNVPSNPILDNTRLDIYGCSAELLGSSDSYNKNGLADGIGTPCHEFSHCLGYPDLYDTSGGSNFGMGSWDIMSSGSYNGNPSAYCPSAYTSYERWQAGWLEPTVLTSETQITGMKALVDSPEAYIIYNKRNKNEYYLLENRQKIGYDQSQYGHGMLVLHVDYSQSSWSYNQVNTVADHQRLTIIPADNEQYSSDPSLAADPFPGTKKKTSLTDYTTPAATLYNANADGRKFMGFAIENITETNGLISFLAGRPEMTIPAVTTTLTSKNSFRASWEAVKDATSYELKLTEYGGKKSPQEANLVTETFEKAYSKSAGWSDISTKLDSYLDNKGFSGTKLYQSPNKLKIGTGTNAGTLKTPWYNPSTTNEVTIVMGVKPNTEGTEVNCKLPLNVNGTGVVETIEFSFKNSGYVILHSSVNILKDFYTTLQPAGIMYINYLAIYDGNFSAAELGIEAMNEAASARMDAPHRATTQTLKTTDNFYEFTDLANDSRFELQVRAVQDASRASRWSDVITITFEEPLTITDLATTIEKLKSGASTKAEVESIVNSILKKNTKPEPTSEWKFIGVGSFVDDVLIPMFSIDPVTYDVDFYESTEHPGLFRVMDPFAVGIHPYGEAIRRSGYTVPDADGSTYITIDAQISNGVYVPYSPIGVDVGKGQMDFVTVAGDAIESGDYTVQQMIAEGATGTVEGNKITFPTFDETASDGSVVKFQGYMMISGTEYGFYVGMNGKISFILPSTYSASSVKNVAPTVDPSLRLTLKKPSVKKSNL